MNNKELARIIESVTECLRGSNVLSKRTIGCLENEEIYTYADIYFKEARLAFSFRGKCTPGVGLLKLKKFGKKSLQEVKTALAKSRLPPLERAHEVAFRMLEYTIRMKREESDQN